MATPNANARMREQFYKANQADIKRRKEQMKTDHEPKMSDEERKQAMVDLIKKLEAQKK